MFVFESFGPLMIKPFLRRPLESLASKRIYREVFLTGIAKRRPGLLFHFFGDCLGDCFASRSFMFA